MPQHDIRQDRIPAEFIARFLDATRRHFEQPATPAPRRPLWPSLLLIGSLGAALGSPALADVSLRRPDPADPGTAATQCDDDGTADHLTGRPLAKR